jgi:TldD protein
MDRNYFFSKSDLDVEQAAQMVETCLAGFDDGELYLQYSESESVSILDRAIKSSSYDISKGFGMRGVIGELTGFAHSNIIDSQNLKEAINVVKLSCKLDKAHHVDVAPVRNVSQTLYRNVNPIGEISYLQKVEKLINIDNYLRDKSPYVKQVSASFASTYTIIQIIRDRAFIIHDIKPIVHFRVMVIVEKNGRSESGFHGIGMRCSALELFNEDNIKNTADEALRSAFVNLESVESIAGEKTVVLGPGYPGILLHEAIGHGLEGDANRKKTSAFYDLMGKKVAANGVTVIDDGTILGRRGSMHFDDEGTPSSKNVLIENGILVNYMQDRMNARLMNAKPTGNGRRQSYSHTPIPRMTNTFMLSGHDDPEAIIADVKDGVYAKTFGSGQVDTTSGKFVFNATECYMIENGKITQPLKGATLIGNGPDILTKITAIGNDFELDSGIGMCGKMGQSVPVGVGQPTLRIDKITVGGTQIS